MPKLQRAKQKRNNTARTLEGLQYPNYLMQQRSHEDEVQFFGALENVDIGSLQCASRILFFPFRPSLVWMLFLLFGKTTKGNTSSPLCST